MARSPDFFALFGLGDLNLWELLFPSQQFSKTPNTDNQKIWITSMLPLRDTFFIWAGEDLGKDRLFNLLYFIPAFWILILITGGVEKLAKDGW